MRIRLGCRLSFWLPQPTPMIMLLNVHYSRASDLERPDLLVTDPPVPIEAYRDGFGNWCSRLIAPAGLFTVSTDGVLNDAGLSDPVDQSAEQQPVEQLPSDVLPFLLASRYCESDVLSDFAWNRFNHEPLGWARVQAVCDFVHNHVQFGYEQSRPTRTAVETLNEGVGVCRDFTHLAVALCRCLNIPTRYCTGYISDIGQPQTHAAMDFAAWMEVYLGGKWWVFDPRNNDTRFGRVLIARGRDAADVPLTHSFGQHDLRGFEVWINEIEDEADPSSGQRQPL
ncbi:Transglutaminase-like superfamily protein [Thalassovita gelatinovora]|uniref:Transglutaminase-like superfamily protein n=1 Tax=Thalassovita gelatinovora TaxID=53501 RepID=A0A0P1FCC7_THAGE|nr:transglutaminase family protein [Thalassovita gelatinovora]QIZ80443.1 transglutaminase family protein [Thalassovita gelatinovora]CUH65845.1 Transglutaminase-like superfamily protein [Thalassovita gelatinovora]SEQ72600.1 Transglutaminase-like enzyme, putative cysteine protease [Thalassovita gelatinovora]